mmetsp:Transcript_627/g.1609  ORF Transcript_627/g.1609 Transcript_627/m.1609 type:complete len:393 (+) Transcript_627:634-1812(+)
MQVGNGGLVRDVRAADRGVRLLAADVDLGRQTGEVTAGGDRDEVVVRARGNVDVEGLDEEVLGSGRRHGRELVDEVVVEEGVLADGDGDAAVVEGRGGCSRGDADVVLQDSRLGAGVEHDDDAGGRDGAGGRGRRGCDVVDDEVDGLLDLDAAGDVKHEAVHAHRRVEDREKVVRRGAGQPAPDGELQRPLRDLRRCVLPAADKHALRETLQQARGGIDPPVAQDDPPADLLRRQGLQRGLNLRGAPPQRGLAHGARHAKVRGPQALERGEPVAFDPLARDLDGGVRKPLPRDGHDVGPPPPAHALLGGAALQPPPGHRQRRGHGAGGGARHGAARPRLGVAVELRADLLRGGHDGRGGVRGELAGGGEVDGDRDLVGGGRGLGDGGGGLGV